MRNFVLTGCKNFVTFIEQHKTFLISMNNLKLV